MEPRIGIAAGMIKSHVHLPQKLLRHQMLSSITVGSYTLNPQLGNPDPNVWVSEDSRWILNAIGLKNNGLLHFLDYELMSMYEACFGATKLRVSLAPTASGELQNSITLINGIRADEFIDELEINGACPNHKKGEHIEPVLAYDMDACEALMAEAGEYRGAKAFKIAPRTPREKLVKLVELCEAYDIGTIVSANSLKRHSIIDSKQVLSTESGGLSGLPLLTDTMSQVGMLRNIIRDTGAKVRIVACGGVLDGRSAETLLREQGADEVQVATLFWTQGEDGLYRLIEDATQRLVA